MHPIANNTLGRQSAPLHTNGSAISIFLHYDRLNGSK
jgi:hypothetical protein